MFKRASGKAVLIADVDDISVGVSIVELSASGPAAVHISERAMLPIEDRSVEQSATAVLKLLDECVSKVLKANPDEKILPLSVYVVVHAPWTRFRTAQASEEQPEPKAVTKAILADLAKKAVTGISELDAANIFETGVMQVFLNGYPTGEPLGKEAGTIAVTAFQSDMNVQMHTGITDVFTRHIPDRPLVMHSGTRTLLGVLHEIIPDIHRYCLLAVRGGATACAIVRKEMVTQSAEVSEGLSTMVRRVSTGGLPEETLAQLRLLAADTCSDDACKAVKDALARAEPTLAKTFGEMFAGLAAERPLPNQCLLFAPAELAPWLQAFFERIDFAQFTATTLPLKVELLSLDRLKSIVEWQTGARQDAGIAIGAGHVHILEQTS